MSNASISESIQIGVTLLKRNSFLEMLLDQVGVDWRIYDSTQNLNTQTSCVILNRSCSDKEREHWKEYLLHTNTVILDTHANLFQLPLSRSRIHPPISAKDPILGRLADLPFKPTTVATSAKAQHLSNSVYHHSRVAYSWCGWRFDPPKNECSQSIKSYPLSSREKKSSDGVTNLGSSILQMLRKASDPSESIHDFPYAHYRHLLFSLLKRLHEFKNLPLVCKSPFPDYNESVFLFRVDSDYSDPPAIRDLFSLLDKHKIRSTWFLHTEAHQGHAELFKDRKSHELAVHGHRHKTYTEAKQLADNIQASIRFLNTIQTFKEQIGYAEPFGCYHRSLVQTLSARNSPHFNHPRLAEETSGPFKFLYSSEFGFDSDNLPHWPLNSNGPLQIPIHPICPGSFSRTSAQKNDIVHYFENQIDLSLMREDPLIFYHHPMQKNHEILESLFSHVRAIQQSGTKIEYLTFSEWAYWWVQRRNTRCKVTYSPSKGFITLQDTFVKDQKLDHGSLFYRVYFKGKQYLTPTGSIKISDLQPFERKSTLSQAVEKSVFLTENRSHQQYFHHLRNELLNQIGRLLQ